MEILAIIQLNAIIIFTRERVEYYPEDIFVVLKNVYIRSNGKHFEEHFISCN